MASTFIFGIACNYFPVLGWIVINMGFKTTIPFINVVFKPWRLYLFSLGVPSLLCAIILFFLPESPKYIFSKGDEEGAIKILKSIYKMNTGEDGDKLNVSKIIEDPEYLEAKAGDEESIHPLVLMWRQIVQLMSKKYIGKTFIACLMQFGIYGCTHGLYMFFPELIDQVSQYQNQNPGGRDSMCKIYEHVQFNASNTEEFNAVSYIEHNFKS